MKEHHRLDLENVTIKVADFKLENINFHINENEYFVLMGPTGSGKSLLLKSICGLMHIHSGKIKICGKEVNELEPRSRKIGYVPQNSALFPNLNVQRNISFPLEVRGIKGEEITLQVRKLAELLGIRNLLGRSTIYLSGGEMQKVALARALACKPDLLLMDEPVSAVDEPTRRELCPLLKQVQNELGIATMHVCHNIEEAKLVADRIGTIKNGELIPLIN